MLPSYALGYSFIEAAYLGMQSLTDNRMVVGDPLTKIYDCPEQILTGTLNSGNYSCRIIVPEGGVLTIPAGAIINFERNGSLLVEGTLIIESNAAVNYSSYSELRVLDTGVLTASSGANINFSEKSIFNVSGIANINDNTTITLNDDSKFNIDGTANINNSEMTYNDDTEFNINKNLYASGSTLTFNDNSAFDIFFKMEAINSSIIFERTTKYFTYYGNDTLSIDNCIIEKGKLETEFNDINQSALISIKNSLFNLNREPVNLSSKIYHDLKVFIENNEFNNFVINSITTGGIKELNIINNEFNGSASGLSTGIILKNNGNVIVDNNIFDNTIIAIKSEERLLEIPELQEDQNITIENNTIENSGTGIQLSDPSNYLSSVELKSNTINNCNDGIVLNNISGFSPGIKGNSITNSTSQGISVTNVDEVTVQNNILTDSNLGVYLANVTNAHIIDNTITFGLNTMPGIFLESSNGELRGNTISGHTNGIELGNSSPDIGDNTITDNLYHGIYIGSGSLPNMVGTLAGNPPFQYPTAGYNDIFENGGWDESNAPPDNDGSEIFISFANALMERGCNSIMDDRAPGGTLINTKYLMGGESFGMPIQVNAEYNFWSVNPLYSLEDRFNNLIVYYDSIYNEPCTLQQGASGGGSELFVTTSNGTIIDTLYSIDREIGELSTTELLYAVAEEKFLTADYENAEDAYNQIINSNDTLFAKLKAYQRLYNLGRLTQKSPDYFVDLKTVYSSLSQAATDSLLGKIFSQLASLSLVGQTEYVSAIEEFDAVVQQNQGTEEAMYAEIDALTTALLLAPDSSLGKGSLGKYSVTDISDYTNRVSNLLKQRVGSSNYIKEPIPTEYALYQNYPNPFNPSTTIKYSIIKAGKVKLAVYDILGREVIVLADEVKEPGFYEVNFDASYLSSGVYFYRIVTEDYVNSKKMILLK